MNPSRNEWRPLEIEDFLICGEWWRERKKDVEECREMAHELKEQIEADIEGQKIVVVNLGGMELAKIWVGYLGIIYDKAYIGGCYIKREGGLLEVIKDALGRLKTLMPSLKEVAADEFARISCEREAEDIREELSDSIMKLGPLNSRPIAKEDLGFGRDKVIEDIKKFFFSEVWLSAAVIEGEKGVGKTTVAQCLYNDNQISEYFDTKVWLSVAHIFELEPSMVRSVLEYNVESPKSKDETLRCLIVLDDLKLEPDFQKVLNRLAAMLVYVREACQQHMFMGILVTSCSEVSDDGYGWLKIHSLSGLSKKESWTLFESIAFGSEGSKEGKDRILQSNISEEICKKCDNNPRVIETVAGILSTKHTSEEWKHFNDVVWPSLLSPVKTIKAKLNRDAFERLPITLKRCVTYCSLFPKDYELTNQDLMLWLAFLSNSLVDCDYFGELDYKGYSFTRCEVVGDNSFRYKMKDFTYEFVKYVKRDDDKCCLVEKSTQQIDCEHIRHVAFVVDSSWRSPPWLLTAKKMQSLHFVSESCELVNISNLDEILFNLRFLETLDLAKVNCVDVSSAIGELKLLRYLRLGATSEFLPQFITKLKNLRVLDLQHSNAQILPKDFQDMQCLSCLYARDKRLDRIQLSHGELISVNTNNVFIVGQNNGSGASVDCNSLADIDANHHYRQRHGLEEDSVSILRDPKLSDILFMWSPSIRKPTARDNIVEDDIVLRTCHPNSTLESFMIRCWKGFQLPRLFPALLNVTSLQIVDCRRCERLPALYALPHLKFLQLWGLDALEYLDIYDDESYNASTYFPSLECVMLANLPKLKAWSPSSQSKQIHRLSKLQLCHLPKLKSMPFMMSLEFLEANDIPVNLLNQLVDGRALTTSPTSASTSTSATSSKLQNLHITKVHQLRSLSIDSLSLESLTIRQCHELTALVAVSLSPLKLLEIHECRSLRDISSAFLHLTSLEKLVIGKCEELDLQNMTPMKFLKSLRSLKLVNMKNLESLPEEVACLTTLEQVSLCWLYNLRALPDWIGNLNQLRHLAIRYCPNLALVPDSLGHSIGNSGTLRMELQYCPGLKKLPASFPESESSQLLISECPNLDKKT